VGSHPCNSPHGAVTGYNAADFSQMDLTMRRLFHFLVNNVREHLVLYLVLWSLLAIIDLIWIWFF
jgi:hypothetical protein